METKEENEIYKFKDYFMKSRKQIIVAVVIIISLCLTTMFMLSSKIQNWSDKIYPGVSVYGLDLGGFKEDEAIELLNNTINNLMQQKNIIVEINDKKFELNYNEINPTINIQEAVAESINYGKDKSIFKKYMLIAKTSQYNVEVKLEFTEEKLFQFEKDIIKEVEKPSQNASIEIKDNIVKVVPESEGLKIEQTKLHEEILKSINFNINDNNPIKFVPEKTQPEIVSKDLETIDAVIASYNGPYTYGDEGRITNLALATEFINGTLLMPGEEFSYNKVVGETTPERGFGKANTYVGTEVVPDYGGGICQISTYLYRAVMRANLEPSLRYNHNMMVGYSEASLDATVYEGDIDYRFVNTYDFPIYIQGIMGDGEITFNICGNKEGFGNKTYDMTNEILESYDFKTIYEDDPTKEVGYEKVKMNGAKGYKSKGYLVTYENGIEVSRKLISTDIYKPLDAVVIRGTKQPPKVEVKPEDKPEVKPEDTPEVKPEDTPEDNTEVKPEDKPSTEGGQNNSEQNNN